MKSLLAFMKKEWMEQVRSGRLLILVIIFILLGIMNPAVAKLTPWLLEMMADSLEASGMTVTAVTVSAMDSWVQFFKNAPMGLIAFILLESSIFTKEYQSGTLVLALTKGLDRHKVVISKAIILTLLWTVCYWFCFTITFGYNTYFWDNSIAQNLFFSVICWWLFGSLVVALTVLFSTLSNSNTGVLAGTGCTVLVSYLIGLIPKAKEYLPTLLMDGNSLIYGTVEARSYVTAIYITVLLSLGFWKFSKFLQAVFSKSVNGFRICLTETVYGGDTMNERFYTLPPEKQQAIINAGYRVFSQNSYKNSPMSEIAAEAGISKSLLFHYFHNKKELYLFLWDKCAETTIEFLTRYGCYGQTELFESMERGMRAKMEIIRLYPDMGNFTIKAFYEKDAGISAAIQESYHRYFNLKADKTRLNLDPSQFIPGLDIPMMYREMYWASEGYLWEMVQQGNVDIEKMEKDFTKLLAFWKSIYLRKE